MSKKDQEGNGASSGLKGEDALLDAELDALEDVVARDFAESASRGEIEAELRRVGIDPVALASRSRDLVGEKLDGRASWKTRAREQLSAARSKVQSSTRRYAAMTRDQLLAHLEALRNHASLSAPVTAAFRKRDPTEASDDELRAILSDMDSLVSIASDGDHSTEESEKISSSSPHNGDDES